MKAKADLPVGYKIAISYFRVPDYHKRRRGKPKDTMLFLYNRARSNWGEDTHKPKLGAKPNSHGGACFVEILDRAGLITAIGESRCSMSDTFSYKIGKDIAIGRALKKFNNPIYVRE